MMKRMQQKGFAHLALVLLVLIAAVVAFAGYKVVKDRQDNIAANKTSTAVTGSVTVIKTNADLDSVTDTLNSQDIDSDLNPDELESDISNLL